jgi:hypothetical protein
MGIEPQTSVWKAGLLTIRPRNFILNMEKNILYFCFDFLTALRSKVFNCKLYCSSKVLTCKLYSSSKAFSCKFYGFSKNLISPVDSQGNAKHLQSIVICKVEHHFTKYS